MLCGRFEAVIGTRFVLQRLSFFLGPERSPFFTHYIGNRIIIALTNILYGQNISDYEGCYKVFTKRLLDSIDVKANGFEYDNELICKILRRGHPIDEVPIRYQPRSYQQGKKINWRDGLRMVWTIVKWRFLPF